MTPQSKWNKAHPEKMAAASKKWKLANAAQQRAYRRAHPEKNRARVVARAVAWNKAHPEVTNALHANRRANKHSATPAWANLAEIAKLYKIAARRSRITGFKWHVDHIVPLQHPLVRGLHVEYNLQVIPAKWNVAKGNRHWPDMPGASL